VLERFFKTLKHGEVYHQESKNYYQARDGISGFIDHYNNWRPHQGIGFITPYEKLTDRKREFSKSEEQEQLLLKK